MRKILRKTNRPKELDITNRILVEPEDYDLMPDLCFDPSPFIAAGASAAASVGSAAINAGSKWGSSTYMRVAKEMADYNTRLNEAQYQKWQSPSALMRQYKEAGLNPNLVYQAAAGAASGGVPAGQVSTNPNDYASDRTRWADALNSVAGAYSVYQDIVAKNSQIKNTDAVTANVDAERQFKQLESEGKRIQNQYANDMMRAQLEGLATENAHRAIKLDNDRIFESQERKTNLLRSEAEIKNSRMDSKKKAAEIGKINSEVASIDQSISESKARIRHMQDTIALGYGNLAVSQENARSNYMNAMSNSGRFNIESAKWEAQRENFMNAQEYQKFSRTGQFPENAGFWVKGNYMLNRILDRIPFINQVSAFSAGQK